jgi:hypothetical protein
MTTVSESHEHEPTQEFTSDFFEKHYRIPAWACICKLCGTVFEVVNPIYEPYVV